MALLLNYEGERDELYLEANCSALPSLHHRSNCHLSSKELVVPLFGKLLFHWSAALLLRNSVFSYFVSKIGERSFVALLRLVFSLLSVLGTLSIIISVVWRRQIMNPKIHPIFMLSLADLLLAVMWVVGGGMWLSGGLYGDHYNRVNCFIVLLITVIVECICINLTCVYALLAHSSIKRKDFTNVYSLFEKDLDNYTWTARRTVFCYMVAWLLPVILVMVPFFVVAKFYNLLEEATTCSCRCLPYFGNILPLANGRDNSTALYMHHLSLLVASYGTVVAVNYLIGFILLVIIYWKILRLINKMKASFTAQSKGTASMATNVFARGHTRAKLRVIYFLTVFMVTGFFNFFLSCGFVAFEIKLLHTKLSRIPNTTNLPSLVLLMYIAQSITVSLQGFLNAIVYGWTREDFILVIRPEHGVTQTQQDSLFRGSIKARSTNSGTPYPYQPTATGGHYGINQPESLVGHDMLYSVESEPDQ